MKKEEYRFGFDLYESAESLAADDRALLESAREITEKACAP